MSELGDVPDELGITKGDDSFKRLLGDVNGDGNINVTDAMLVVDYILGKPVPVFIYINADTDENKTINVADAMWIVDYILGKN